MKKYDLEELDKQVETALKRLEHFDPESAEYKEAVKAMDPLLKYQNERLKMKSERNGSIAGVVVKGLFGLVSLVAMMFIDAHNPIGSKPFNMFMKNNH